MTFKLAEPQAGWPGLGDVTTDQRLELGTVARIVDRNGDKAGEAVYARSGDALLVGSLVNLSNEADVLLAPAVLGVGGVGVSFNIVPDLSYSWFQVAGEAAVLAPNAATIGAGVWMLAATAGSVDDAVVASEQILNAAFASSTGVPVTGQALINIDRPFHQGAIT